MCIYICVSMCIHVYVSVCMCMSVYVCVCVYACMHACMYVCMCVCVSCVCLCVYVYCVYIHIYIYTAKSSYSPLLSAMKSVKIAFLSQSYVWTNHYFPYQSAFPMIFPLFLYKVVQKTPPWRIWHRPPGALQWSASHPGGFFITIHHKRVVVVFTIFGVMG